MSTKFLRVKIKTLADEAYNIRCEENALFFVKMRPTNPTRVLDGTPDGRVLNWVKTRVPCRDPELLKALRDHRKGIVRDEARASHWAYAFLRGVPFHKIETKPYDEKDLDHLHMRKKMEAMVRRYGAPDQLLKIDAWLTEARTEPLALAS